MRGRCVRVSEWVVVVCECVVVVCEWVVAVCEWVVVVCEWAVVVCELVMVVDICVCVSSDFGGLCQPHIADMHHHTCRHKSRPDICLGHKAHLHSHMHTLVDTIRASQELATRAFTLEDQTGQ